MPPHSYLEWIAGANVPRPSIARPKRRICAEYETDDEDEEVEFLVRSKKKSPNKTKYKDKDERIPSTKEPSLKSALKRVVATVSDVSDNVLSSDKEVETSGSDAEMKSASTSASVSAVEDRCKDFDPGCPCRHCVKTHKALTRSRLGKKAKRVSFSDDDDDTDASDDAETVHNFFKWNLAMEAKKARDQDAKDYKEYLADKAKREETAKKEAEKKKEDGIREKVKKEEEKKKQEKKKEEETRKNNETEKGKGKQGNPKDNKVDSSSKETAEASNSEADNSKEGTDAEASDADSQKRGRSAAKTKDKKSSEASPAPSEPNESDLQETTVIQLLMEQLLKRQKRNKSKKKKSKHEDKERDKLDQEKVSSRPAGFHDPNWLMPPRSSVVHVEHTMEAPTDPRPNAFFDNRNGVMRVYHGSSYGNPTGALYQEQGPGAASPPPARPQHGNFNNNKDYNGYGSHFPPQPYDPSTGHPPPYPTRSMPRMQQTSANQWFQGSGTTVVPGTPAGGQQNPEFVKPSAFPSGSHSFTDLMNRFGNSPYNTNRPQTSRDDQRTYFKPTFPTESPGFDPAYFHASSAAANSNLFNNTNLSRGVQNSQSVDASSMPSKNDHNALMAKELAELKARENGFIGRDQYDQPSSTMGVPPATRTSPQKTNGAATTSGWTSTLAPSPDKDGNNTDSWNNPTSAAAVSTNSNDWTNIGNAANTNDVDSSWGNGGDNVSPQDDNCPTKTSPTYSNNGNNKNNDNTTASPFQNVSVWPSQPSDPAQNAMPGAYPSPSMASFVENELGNADWDTSQDNNAAQKWGDTTVANSSGGYWESGADDAGKSPAVGDW